jgi:hypothetical protein
MPLRFVHQSPWLRCCLASENENKKSYPTVVVFYNLLGTLPLFASFADPFPPEGLIIPSLFFRLLSSIFFPSFQEIVDEKLEK